MVETLFGPAPQVWPPLSVPAFSYFQTLPGPRVLGSPGAFTPLPAPIGSGGMLSAPLVTGAGSPDQLPVNAGQLGVAPALIGNGVSLADYASVLTPHALLATVAMRRGQPMGPTNDPETEDFICDALDLMSGAGDVEVRCEGGKALLTGSVPNKRVKHDIGEVAWAIPSVNDVQNNVTIAARRRSRTARDTEVATAVGASRKQG